MERGERNPSLSTILKIATTLDVPASEVLARAERLLSAPQVQAKQTYDCDAHRYDGGEGHGC
jgi:transcriptional regulator with XRE-family HTH domain